MEKLHPRIWMQTLFVLVGIAGIVSFLLYMRFFSTPSSTESQRPSLAMARNMENFLAVYWQRSIPLQGVAPTSYTGKEASLKPEACGSCHTRQYADWKESLHSHAMGPGPWGQIIDLTQTSPEEAIQCMSCHAPLSEQMPLIAKTTDAKEQTYAKNPYFDVQLQLEGITCAACHVRQHHRFGPPKTEGVAATNYPAGMPNHGGVQRTPYFEKAEFCKACHQFDPDNTTLANGKPIQDTYREWKNSIWGQGGVACQDCHMPGRRHLWKGIHDPEWVKGGVRVETHLKKPDSTAQNSLELSVEVTNAAVGHRFPTYLTPKVFVRAALSDKQGKILPGTTRERIIGWDVRFENGEWKEYFDTRIAPGETSENRFRWSRPAGAEKVRTWIEVYPDHFYHVHFYPAYLKGENLSSEGRKLIENASKDSGTTPYILFEESIPMH